MNGRSSVREVLLCMKEREGGRNRKKKMSEQIKGLDWKVI